MLWKDSNWGFKDLDGSKTADFDVIRFYQMSYVFEVSKIDGKILNIEGKYWGI